VWDWGYDTYSCHFCSTKDLEAFQTRWFKVINEDDPTIMPEKNGNLTPTIAKNIWKQIRDRLDNPEETKTI